MLRISILRTMDVQPTVLTYIAMLSRRSFGVYNKARYFQSSRAMVKAASTVIEYLATETVKGYTDNNSEFNGLVNMNATELQEWLKTEASTSSGWHNKDDESETVGHAR